MGRRFQQPQGPVQVDWANPLSRGLVDALLPGQQGATDPITGQPWLIGGTPQAATYRTKGAGLTTTSAGNGYAYKNSARISGTDPAVSMFASVCSIGSGTDRRILSLGSSASVTPILALGQGFNTASKARWFSRDNGSATSNTVDNTNRDVFDGTPHSVLATTLNGNGGGAVYVDGTFDSTIPGFSGSWTLDRTCVGGLLRSTFSAGFDGASFVGLIWARALLAEEAKALHENPWQLFRPISSRTWFLMTGGGGANFFDGSLADGADTLAGAVSPLVAGSSATTDGADALLSAVSPVIASTLATTDGADVLASSASPVVSATSAPTDGADVLAASVSLTNGVDVSGLLVDGADTLSSNVGVVVGFSVAASDGPDALSAVVSWPDLSNSKRAGDAGKDYKHKKPKNHRDEVRKAILEAMEGPKVLAEQVREAVKPYASSETVSVQSLDWSAIEADIERVQAVIDRAKKKFQDDEEEALLLLMT